MTLRCFRKLAISTACVAMRIFGSFFFISVPHIPSRRIFSRAELLLRNPKGKCGSAQFFSQREELAHLTQNPRRWGGISIQVPRAANQISQPLLSPSDNFMNNLFFQFSSSSSSDMIKKTLTSCWRSVWSEPVGFLPISIINGIERLRQRTVGRG